MVRTRKPDVLLSMGSQRVGHNWVTEQQQQQQQNTFVFQCRQPGFNPWLGKIPWRRKWHATPLFLPGEPHGQRILLAAVHGFTKSQTQLSSWVHTCYYERIKLQFRFYPKYHQFKISAVKYKGNIFLSNGIKKKKTCLF